MTDWHPAFDNTWEAIHSHCRDAVAEHVPGINRQIQILKIA